VRRQRSLHSLGTGAAARLFRGIESRFFRIPVITIFAMPKPFHGHIEIIQRNAIQSWMRLDPGVELILFGDEHGTAGVCKEFGLRHVRTWAGVSSALPC